MLPIAPKAMPPYTRIRVVCPGNAMTAGPEALHQLVADLNRLGQAAAIVYHPFDRTFEPPEPYRTYRVPVDRYVDEPGTLILFPEIFTVEALRPTQAEVGIWWMSVNNFTGQRYGYPWRDKLRYWKYLLKGKRPWGGVKTLGHLRHFAQSDYAKQFLLGHGITSAMLSDPIPVYTTEAYQATLPSRLQSAQREDVILFNPKKGVKITAKLMATFPQWRFAPLIGLNRDQLAEAFLKARLYIDFGHHPGKDRLPREAAIHGCCVITARHGSAANPVDLPISEEYKLDVKDKDLVRQFGDCVTSIFSDFNRHQAELAPYQKIIAQEPIAFDRQILEAFQITPRPDTTKS